MTSRTIPPITPSAPESAGETEGKRIGILAWLIFLPLGVLALFAVNLFILEPIISRVVGPAAAQFSYIVLRVAGLVALAFGLARGAQRNRFQTISTVLLVGFLDQVFLKGLWVKRDLVANPVAWQGFEPTNAAIFVNLATGYLFFVPIVLILCFLGMEATRFKRDWTYRP